MYCPTVGSCREAAAGVRDDFVPVQQRCCQTALERQILSCTYLAHDELESGKIVIICIITVASFMCSSVVCP